jgi:hypothetical protein
MADRAYNYFLLRRKKRLMGAGGGISPTIQLSGLTILTGSVAGDLVGLISVLDGTANYTFAITADPDSKFVIDGVDNTRLELEATVTSGAHSVTIEATPDDASSVLTRTFVITVQALTLALAATEGADTAAFDVGDGADDSAGQPIGLLLALTKTTTAPGPSGSGLLDEDGFSFLLAENGDYLIQEAA